MIPKGGRFADSSIEGDQWRVALDDQGRGSRLNIETEFERFFQAEPVGRRSGRSGSASRFAEHHFLHGGKIWAELCRRRTVRMLL